MSAPWSPDEAIARFLEEFLAVCGAPPLSVLLFGSVARGEARQAVSDVNVLCLVSSVTPEALARCSPVVRRWREEAALSVLVSTPSEWTRSRDVFPLEIADMKEASRVLHGSDPVETVELSLRKMRLQAEREIRGKILHLREGILLTADEPAELSRLTLSAVPSIATYLRGALRLADREVPADTPTAAREAGRLVGADPAPFLHVWEARSTPGALRGDPSTAAGLTGLLEAAAEFVDAMDTNAHSPED